MSSEYFTGYKELFASNAEVQCGKLDCTKATWLCLAFYCFICYFDVLYHKSSNNEYLKAFLRYHKGMMMVLDDEAADKIRLEFLPGSDTHDVASLMMNRFYKDNAYAWQQCMGKPN